MSDRSIKEIFSALHKGEIDAEEAKERLMRLPSYDLADYLVESFNMGWITPFNVGLDEDGNII